MDKKKEIVRFKRYGIYLTKPTLQIAGYPSVSSERVKLIRKVNFVSYRTGEPAHGWWLVCFIDDHRKYGLHGNKHYLTMHEDSLV